MLAQQAEHLHQVRLKFSMQEDILGRVMISIPFANLFPVTFEPLQIFLQLESVLMLPHKLPDLDEIIRNLIIQRIKALTGPTIASQQRSTLAAVVRDVAQGLLQVRQVFHAELFRLHNLQRLPSVQNQNGSKQDHRNNGNGRNHHQLLQNAKAAKQVEPITPG